MEALREYRDSVQKSYDSYWDNLKKYQEIKDLERDNWMETLDLIAKSGMTDDQIPADYLDNMDSSLNLPPGCSADILRMARVEYEMSLAEKELALEKSGAEVDKIYADMEAKSIDQLLEMERLLNDTPEGTSFFLNGFEYFGRKKATPHVFEAIEVDNDGEATLVFYDKDIGIESLRTVSLGNIGAAKDGWVNAFSENGGLNRFNTRTNEVIPVMSKEEFINPALLPGFSEWAYRHGQVTTQFDEQTLFEKSHPGIDIGNVEGTAIEAFFPEGVTEMTVSRVRGDQPNESEGYGNFIELVDTNGTVYRYSHLQEGVGLMDRKAGDKLLETVNVCWCSSFTYIISPVI